MFVSQNEVHLGQIQANMEICISDYEKRPNYYHFQKMRKFKRYWAGIFSRGLCLGCLLCCCQIFLPCGHALCETCYRNSTSTETVHGNLLTTNGSLRCHACPLCWKEFPNFKVTLSPPTASGRILSLDGGGVLGLVTMKLLERLFKEIELDLSFHELFDGIWGSSVGNERGVHLRSTTLTFARRYNCHTSGEEEVDIGRMYEKVPSVCSGIVQHTKQLAGVIWKLDSHVAQSLQLCSKGLLL